jgi:hypothetical protein
LWRAIIDINSEESFRLIVETIPGLIAVMTPAGEVADVTVCPHRVEVTKRADMNLPLVHTFIFART